MIRVRHLALLFTTSVACSLAAADPVDFATQIRPLLSDNCFSCHGPDEHERKADLRLDTREGAFADLGGYAAVVAGDPDASELLYRITTDDADDLMPPEKSGKSLTAGQIDLIKRWIAEGANWEEHWAFTPPVASEVPTTRFEDHVTNPVDAFLFARLEKEGLAPSPEADRTTLIRRVTLDLTGLPPTPQETAAFVGDDSPDAFEKLVDRLLASNRYGEHMARFWLDAARYGDTHGLHLDNYREIWPYRDWVIRAFNENKPYDEFLIEQVAGDLLPEPTEDQLIATGFNRSHVTTSEGGSIEEEVRIRNVNDRVATFGTVAMGLTMDCTRCHDHKFDPLTAKDFYAMSAYFNSIDGNPLDGNAKRHHPVLRLETPEQKMLLEEYDTQLGSMRERLKSPWPEVDAEQTVWVRETRDALLAQDGRPERPTLGAWHLAGPFAAAGTDVFNAELGPEGRQVTLSGDAAPTAVDWQKKDDFKDGQPATLPTKENETTAAYVYREIHSKVAQTINVGLGSDDALKVYLNGRMIFARDIARGVAPDQERLSLALREGKNELLLKVVNYAAGSAFHFNYPDARAGIPDNILAILRKEADTLETKERETLRDHYRNAVSQHPVLKLVKEDIAQTEKARNALDDQVVTTLIWKEREKPREAFVLKRGEYDQPGEAVARATPGFLPPLPDDQPNNRLGLARWLFEPENPLTARVAVNRFWQQVFGTGLVKTSEDFGSQGEPPSHPKLLDWLAVQFREEGWDMKATMKRLVMSSAYRQSSALPPGLYERDPENRLLARGPRFRLDAEMLRDQALFVGGLLHEEIGGPGVKPPQPPGLWEAVGYTSSNTARFTADTGSDKVHRRALYTFFKRTAPPPQMTTFDAPSRESCTVRRERTNTPLQALVLLNDEQYVEAARALAQRAMREGGTSRSERAARMFQLCVGREPAPREVAELLAAFDEDREYYRNHPEAARELIAVGETDAPDTVPPDQLAAWTVSASVLLNLDEVIMKN